MQSLFIIIIFNVFQLNIFIQADNIKENGYLKGPPDKIALDALENVIAGPISPDAISSNRLYAVLALTATIKMFNDALKSVDATIVTMSTESPIIVLSIPDTHDKSKLSNIIKTLEKSPAFISVSIATGPGGAL